VELLLELLFQIFLEFFIGIVQVLFSTWLKDHPKVRGALKIAFVVVAIWALVKIVLHYW
jgi:NhaP-type Na+/H+ or K+/H+ antiporter